PVTLTRRSESWRGCTALVVDSFFAQTVWLTPSRRKTRKNATLICISKNAVPLILRSPAPTPAAHRGFALQSHYSVSGFVPARFLPLCGRAPAGGLHLSS